MNCGKCGVELTDENWYPSSQRHPSYICNQCMSEKNAEWYSEHRKYRDAATRKWCKEHPDQYRAKKREQSHRRKIKALTHYSPNLRCQHCGFSDVRALSIDHINNDGYSHRKKLGRRGGAIYCWLITNNFPPGYQVLCMNCQFIKRFEQRKSITVTETERSMIHTEDVRPVILT